MRSLWNKKSVFTKLFATYSVMSILTALFIGIVSYEASTRLYARQIEKDSVLLLEQYKALIETDIMNPAMEIAIELLINSEFEDINRFFLDEVNYGELYWYNLELDECLSGERDLIRDVYLHNLNNELILSSKEGLIVLESREYSWWALEDTQEQVQNVGWSVQWYDNNIHGLRYRQKYPLSGGGQIRGYIVVDVNVKAILELMESLGEHQAGELLLFDKEGNLIPIAGEEYEAFLSKEMSLEQQGGGMLLSIGRQEHYFSYSSPFSNGWRLAMLTPVMDFYASSLFLQKVIVVLTGLCIMAGLFLSIYFSKNIYGPVKKIVGKLQDSNEKRSGLTGNEYEFIDREILHLSDTVQELNAMLRTYNPMIEYNILSGIINRTMRDKGVLQQRMELLGLQSDKPCVTAIVIKIGNLIFDIMDEKNLQIFKIHVINLVKNVCSNQCIISEYKPDEMVAMIFHEKEDMDRIAYVLEKETSINPTGSLSIGIGGSYEETMQFVNSYAEAKEALQYAYFNSAKMMYWYSEFVELAVPREDVLGRYNKEFDKHIKAGNLGAVLDLIEQIENHVQSFPYQYEYMNRKLLEMVGIFARYCKEVCIKTEDGNLESRFLNADRLHDFLIPFKEMVTEVIHRHNADMEKRNEKLVLAACKYIDDHLGEDLSLSLIAEDLGVSEGHLSRMFKKATDKSILEYITEKRMKEAKRLLTETSYSIEKIANLSGYRTPHYFGQKFKETYGYTPTYYREIIRKQGEKCDV